MSKKKDYIPHGIGPFYNFVSALVAIVVAQGAGWGLATALITALQTAFNTYEALYNAQLNPNARTKAQVEAHRVGRIVFEAYIRQFVKEHLISNSAITRDEKVEMGLNPGDDTNTPRPPITTAPVLNVKATAGCRVKIECRVEADESRPSIQKDSDGVELRYSLGTAPANWQQATNVVLSSRARKTITFAPDSEGQLVYWYASWFNKSDDSKSGPFCTRQQVKLME